MYVFNGYLFSQRPTGVMRYAREILQVIDGLCNKDEFVLLVPTYAKNIPDVLKLDILPSVTTFFQGLIYFSANYEMPNNVRTIGVYHGFRTLELPIEKTAYLYSNKTSDMLKSIIKYTFNEMYFEKQYKEQKKIVDRCDILIGVSEHSGYSAKMFFPECSENKIKIFYSPEKYAPELKSGDKILTKKEILMLGGNRWEKNVYRGAMAIDQLFSNNQLQGYSVKIVGGLPVRVQRKLHNLDRFELVGYLPAEELEASYKACDFFLYPTLNEGFGYPPLEAMKYGKTCILSAVTSLPEIYKDSVYYCNPYDVNEIKMRVLQAAEDKIGNEIIKERYDAIRKRQNEDLVKLCNLILEE